MSASPSMGIPEVARRLGVSTARVRQFIRQGRLHSERLVGTPFHVVTERELARFEALTRRVGRPGHDPTEASRP